MPIPITVFTGFLGAGKTTLILSLLPHLPDGYRACLLKNEFGDVEVDSHLAKQSGLAAVSEILNGCMCCILVGQMKTALLEIKEKFSPDRIFIETSGSAFPATLAFQIRELERETGGEFKLDAIITVIDAENFTGYEDTSPTARMQASYTDLILINKWEHVSERALDIVIDHLHTLNDLTPKIKWNGKSSVDLNIIFGIDTKLFSDNADFAQMNGDHNEEVQTVTIRRRIVNLNGSHYHHSCDLGHETSRITTSFSGVKPIVSEHMLTSLLEALPKGSVWRVKGFVYLLATSFPEPSQSVVTINWAFGRLELKGFNSDADGIPDPLRRQEADILLTVMGERGEVKGVVRNLAEALGAEIC